MNDWVPTVIAASGALVGGGVGAAATLAAQRTATDSQARHELAAQLSAYGHALDALQATIIQLPRSTRATRAIEKLINAEQTPTLDGLLAWLNAKTVGRDALAALDHFLVVSNRLLLIAPKDIVALMERVSRLVAGSGERDGAWQAEWSEVRSEIAKSSRRHATRHRRLTAALRWARAAPTAVAKRVKRCSRASPS